MTNRIDRVNSLLEHEISKILLHDFTFSPDILVTLTKVRVTANLIEAKAYISVFPEAKVVGIIGALNKSIFDVQNKINRTLRMRPTPKIIFVKETEVSKAARVEKLLAQAEAQEIEKNKKIK